MFRWLTRSPRSDTIARLDYGMIVAQARAAPFYLICGVPDTVNGRFEMVVLTPCWCCAASIRAGPDPPPGAGLFDQFCQDMDGSLREMGIGDLGVPTKMRKIGEAFYGRQAAYGAARIAAACTLIGRCARYRAGGRPIPSAGARQLAPYVRGARRPRRQDGEPCARGRDLPGPASHDAVGRTLGAQNAER